jgi:hypothetical protein
LVVFLADDFLVVFLAAFLAMALSPPFCAQTLMPLEKSVNGFLRWVNFFSVDSQARDRAERHRFEHVMEPQMDADERR